MASSSSKNPSKKGDASSDAMSTDGEDYNIAKGGMLGKRNATKKYKSDQTPIPIKNAYDDLTDNESNTSLINTSPKRKLVKKNKGDNNTDTFKVPKAPTDRAQKKNKENRTVKAPPTIKPIYAKISHGEIQTMRDALKPSVIYSSRIRSNGEFKLTVDTKVGKDKVLEWMKFRNIHCHTFSEKEDLPLNFILNGYFTVECPELLKTLNDNKVPAINVRNISKSTENPTYLVRFKKETVTFDSLKAQHSTIDFHKVIWNKLKKKPERIAQCTRCQSFLHTWRYCNREQRCVKCNEIHERGQCKRVSRDEGLPFCVNCQVEGHPSNWTGCPHRRKLIEKLKKQQPKKSQRTVTSNTNAWTSQEPETSPKSRKYNVNFPQLSNTHSVSFDTSTGSHMRVNEPREGRPALHNSRYNTMSDNPFDRLADVGDRLNSLEDFDTTISMYESLVGELETTTNHFQRIQILIRYSGQLCP